jgi:hypothetical protein
MRDLEWRDGDTEQSYLARVRAAAAELGGTCEEDEAELQRVAPSLALTLERTSSKAGEQVKFVWSGNGLARSMPAYLVVATDSAVRFDGNGFYGLLPDALGPFGIEWSRSKSRAIVPLFGSRAARGGEIGIRPLLAGETTVEAALVGYQRSCRIETAIPLIRSSIAVEPAEPRIVLNSDPIAVTYDRFVDVTAFNRKVELSKDRYLITDASEGSEIAERPGRDLRISPTGRFVIAQADGGYEIVDIVDGAVLANVAGVDVGWINHDSFGKR